MSQPGIGIMATFTFPRQEFSHLAVLTAKEVGKRYLAEYTGKKVN